MAANFQKITTRDLGGGMDQRSGENAIPETFSEDLENCTTNSNGLLSKRPGYQGYYGWLPMRVTQVDHDGTDIVFTFDNSLNIEDVATTPIVVYGLLSAAQSGDWSTTNNAEYYSSFTSGAVTNLLSANNAVTKSNLHDTVNLFTGMRVKDSTTDTDNTWLLADSFDIDNSTPFAVDINYTVASDTDVYFLHSDKDAVGGETYVADDTTTSATGDVLTITAATHGLDNFHIITQHYYLDGTEYREFIPDTVTVDNSTGQVDITASLGASVVTKHILSVPSAANIKEGTISASSTDTIVVSTTNDFNFWSLYAVSGSTLTQEIPDGVVTDVSADTMTFTIQNSTGSSKSYKIYYEAASLLSNALTVTDNSATSATYTDTDPQLTVWGIPHTGNYTTSANTEGHTTHIDNYNRAAEERLIAGLGGNLFRARTQAEDGATHLIPSTAINIEDRTNADTVLAPTFGVHYDFDASSTSVIDVTNNTITVADHSYANSDIIQFVADTGTLPTGVSAATDYYIVSATTNAFKVSTSDGGSAVDITAVGSGTCIIVSKTLNSDRAEVFSTDHTPDGALITAVTFQSSTSVTYTLSLTDKVGSLSSSITTTSATADYLTVTGCANEINNGTFKITAVDNSANTITCTNESLTIAFDETGVKARGQINTDRFTLANNSVFLPSDVMANESFGAISPTVNTSSSTTLVLDAVTKKIDMSGGEKLYATRTSDVIPMTATTNFVAGDMCTVTGLSREIRVNSINPNTSTLTISTITVSGTTATLTTSAAHGLIVGDRVNLLRTGVTTYDGAQTVLTTPSTTTFTFSTTDTTGCSTGVIQENTMHLDESFSLFDDDDTPMVLTVTGRWIPIEAPTSSDDQIDTTYVSHFDSKDYEKQDTMRSTTVADNMYLTNNADEVFKFDGSDLYQAGLPRWQPQLFVQVDTTTGSITPSENIVAGSDDTTNKFTPTTAGHESVFSDGDVVIGSSGATYIIQKVDTVNNIIYTTTTLGGSETSLRLSNRFKYYFRLNAIDANQNIIASAVTGVDDFVVDLGLTAAQIKMRLLGFPLWGIYDYDAIELEVYRTRAGTAAPFYRVAVKDLTFSLGSGYVDFTDASEDEFLTTLDSINTALKGIEVGSAWTQPLRAKYITSTDNRLILGNVKDYPQLDMVLSADAGLGTINAAALDTKKLLLKRDSTSSASDTDMVDVAEYEFVDGGAVTITPNTDIANDATTFTVTSTSHGRVAGDWVYMYHNAAGTVNSLTYAGWWQINSADTNTFTIKANMNTAASANDVDRFVSATQEDSKYANIPVWLGTDGNYNQVDGNDDNEVNAMFRLAAAINASMRMADTSLSSPDQTSFVPWVIASAGSEFRGGQLILRQEKVEATTMEMTVPAAVTNATWFVNDISRTAADEVSAASQLFPSRVLISYKNFPETFDNPAGLAIESDSAVDVNAADGQDITGIIPFFGSSTFGSGQVEESLVVFKTNSIYLLDVRTREVQKIQSRGLGCTAPYSIASTRDGIMFANNSGIYRLNRNQSITYVGKNMEKLYQDDVNRDQLSVMTGHHYAVGRQYKLSLPVGASQTTNNQVYVYDHQREGQQQELGAWTRFTNHPVTGWANQGNDAFFGTTDGQVMSIRRVGDETDYRDDASAISMIAILRAEDFGVPGSRKIVGSITSHFQLRRSSMTGTELSISADLDGSFSSAGTFTLTKDSTIKVGNALSSLPRRRLSYLQMKYTNSTKDEDVVLAGIDFNVALLSEKGVPDRASTT